MTRPRAIGAAVLWAATAAALCTACSEDPPDNEIPQFDRPQDLALVCCDLTVTDEDVEAGAHRFLPLDCCRNEGDGVVGYCNGPNLAAQPLAFVTQTTIGEVAVVDVENQEIIDQDERVPLNSFIPVGSQPSDIAAAWNGELVYTANFGTEDLSVIDANESFGPTMTSSSSIDMGGPAGRILIARPASIRDRFAFVTQPTLGRLSVVELPHDGEPGRLLGYLRMDRATGLEHAPVDDSAEGIVPWAIAAHEVRMSHGDPLSDQTFPSLYVSGKQGTYILEVDSEVLVEQALQLPEPGYLGPEAIVRRIELYDFTVRSMAVEPDLGRWIYAVENEEGGVIVVDLTAPEGDLLPVNLDNPLAENAYSIDVPGMARAVSMVRLAEGDEDTNPLTFNGTFGVVSTTKAAIFVIDAEDRNAPGDFPSVQHALRSWNDWYDEEEGEYTFPSIEDGPTLDGDGVVLAGEDYPHFDEVDSGTGDDFVDAGVYPCDAKGEFRVEGDFGIRLRCDYRQTTSEVWTLSWEGDLGVSGAAVADWDNDLSTGGRLVIVDESKGFCAAGALGGEDDPDGAYQNLYDGLDGLEGYRGDVLIVTSAATPVDGADCSEYDDASMSFRILKFVDPSSVLVEPVGSSPLPDHSCFGQAFNYKLRADNHWTISGSDTGYLRRGSTDTTTGQCLPVAATEADEERQHWKNMRVFPGADFYNLYLKFRLLQGTADLGEFDELTMSFETVDGFEKLGYVLGNDITDIEPAPDSTILVVDQAGEGLIVFDMVGSFEVVGAAIN